MLSLPVVPGAGTSACKLGAHSQAQAVAYALRDGIVARAA
jgi:hypothetical protein